MTTEEKIKVMQAYEEGKAIQVSPIGFAMWNDKNMPPLWNWAEYDYRIKPEEEKPTYRPYKDTDEMIADFKERFGANNPPYTMPLIWIRHKHSETKSLISRFNGPSVEIGMWVLNIDDLCLDHCYLDGTPCGKLVEE